MGSKKKRKTGGKRPFGSPEFAVGTQRDLKLNLGFRDGQNALSHLGSGGVVENTRGELLSDIKTQLGGDSRIVLLPDITLNASIISV
jgi:hypothetical protein